MQHLRPPHPPRLQVSNRPQLPKKKTSLTSVVQEMVPAVTVATTAPARKADPRVATVAVVAAVAVAAVVVAAIDKVRASNASASMLKASPCQWTRMVRRCRLAIRRRARKHRANHVRIAGRATLNAVDAMASGVAERAAVMAVAANAVTAASLAQKAHHRQMDGRRRVKIVVTVVVTVVVKAEVRAVANVGRTAIHVRAKTCHPVPLQTRQTTRQTRLQWRRARLSLLCKPIRTTTAATTARPAKSVPATAMAANVAHAVIAVNGVSALSVPIARHATPSSRWRASTPTHQRRAQHHQPMLSRQHGPAILRRLRHNPLQRRQPRLLHHQPNRHRLPMRTAHPWRRSGLPRHQPR